MTKQTKMQTDTIGAPQPIPKESNSFAGKLKDALFALPEGECIDLVTKHDRQVITNAVLFVKKKTARNLKTKLLQRRDGDGRMVIRIERVSPAE